MIQKRITAPRIIQPPVMLNRKRPADAGLNLPDRLSHAKVI